MSQKRLLLDLEKCEDCEDCAVKCSYFYRPRLEDHGVLSLRELAAFALVCRRCENPSCAAACAFQALERQANGLMHRYNMRCVSCKCCSHACPFGTIYPDTLAYFATPCDLCAGRVPAQDPACVADCARQALQFVEIEPDEAQGIFLLNDRVAVKAPRWVKQAV